MEKMFSRLFLIVVALFVIGYFSILVYADNPTTAHHNSTAVDIKTVSLMLQQQQRNKAPSTAVFPPVANVDNLDG